MNLQISHHLLLCASPKNALCCKPENGINSWKRLKKILKDLNLEDPQRPEGIVLRSKVDCLRVCKEGPILLIWPDGIWYEKVTPDLIEQIINQHVIGGIPIQEFICKQTPLQKYL